jgi:hypothetical protein
VLRLCIALAAALALLPRPLTAGGDESALKYPDYAAIKRAAQRLDPNQEYVRVLPARWAECHATAETYRSTRTTEGLILGDLVMNACLEGMLAKMGHTYYDARAFSPGGIERLADKIEDNVDHLYQGIYLEQRECRGCGSMWTILPQAEVNRVLEGAVKGMAWARLAFDSSWPQWEAAWDQVEAE